MQMGSQSSSIAPITATTTMKRSVRRLLLCLPRSDMLGWGVPTLDSHYVFSYLLESEGSWNATGYNNARVNEITSAITSETDLDKRTAMIDEAWKIIQADKPYLPVHHQVLAWGMSDKLEKGPAATRLAALLRQNS